MDRSKKQSFSKTVIIYKITTGTVELILGLSILFFGKKIDIFYSQYKIKELLEDPHDALINFIDRVVYPFIIHHHTYLIILLIALGFTKIIGAIGLLRNKEWGIDLLIILFILLLPFDILNLFSHITLLKFIYFVINLLIALYLMQFKPFSHIKRLKKYFVIKT